MENKEKYIIPEVEVIIYSSDEILITSSFGYAKLTGYYEDDIMLG